MAILETSLRCSPDHNDIKHCVVREDYVNVQPAEIYCNGKIGKMSPRDRGLANLDD